MRCTTLCLIVLCAALSFGGSFTCKGESNGDGFTEDPRTPVGNR